MTPLGLAAPGGAHLVGKRGRHILVILGLWGWAIAYSCCKCKQLHVQHGNHEFGGTMVEKKRAERPPRSQTPEPHEFGAILIKSGHILIKSGGGAWRRNPTYGPEKSGGAWRRLAAA